MSYYYKLGQIPHKRHTQFRQPDGSLYHEELMGIHGFVGNKSLLYHLRPPTEVQRIERGCEVKMPYADAGPVQHRLLRTADIPAERRRDYGPRPADGQQRRLHFGGTAERADDLLVSLRARRRGDLRSRRHRRAREPVRHAALRPWRLPRHSDRRHLAHRLPDPAVEQRMLVVETSGGHIEPPRRYVNQYGQFLESAPYSERDIRPPDALVTHDEKGEFEVRVKARGFIARYIYPHHPLDVVGWDGHLWPFAFNIEDFEPITGRVHQPPPVHQTFDGPGFVLCSFVPRLFDYHPLSIPAPYNHSNVDSDEVIYYVKGDFMSRKDIEPAAITVHPNGIPHGPHPGTYEGSIGKTRTDELAVMVDTFRPLQLTTQALDMEDDDLPVQLDPSRLRRASRRHSWLERISRRSSRRSKSEFMGHPVVTDNAYTAWFSHGEMPLDHLRRFTIEFSVFSNQFLLAALNRVINADTLHAARESKEILMNELGVIYNSKGGQRRSGAADDRRRFRQRRRSCAGVDRRHRRRRQVPFPGRALRMAAALRPVAGPHLRRHGQTPARHSEHAAFLRRAVPALRQRRLQRGDGRRVRRRELGGRRVLERADCAGSNE